MEFNKVFQNRDELFKTFLENTRDLLFISQIDADKVQIV